MKKTFIIIAIYAICLTSICFGKFDFSILETGQIDTIDSTNLSQVYYTINYPLRYNKYIRDYGTLPTEQRYRQYSPNVAVANYAEPKNQKLVRQYIQALKRQNMGKVEKLLDYSRNTGNNELLRFNRPNIKPMVIKNGVLGFQTNLYGKGVWFYHFIQDYKYYIISSKPISTYEESYVSLLDLSGNNILKYEIVNTISPERKFVDDVSNAIDGANTTNQKNKIIKRGFDDFVMQITNGWGQ